MSNVYMEKKLYSESFIEQIKSRLDIVDVISSYIPTQRKGRDYWACCPFHHEKTPSFQIRNDQQIYRCYGCGKHGNIFTFIMEEDGINFVEAIEVLAKRAGLDLPEQSYNAEEIKRKKLVDKVYTINKETALFYYNNLKTKDGEEALQYLAERGLTRETILKFGIGYSADFDTLPDYLVKKGYDIDSLKTAGVIGISEKGKPYDFFGGRLIIPIINGAGKVVGFTGRVLVKKPDFAKYKNTSTTPVFKKEKHLFGINNYKKYRQNTPRKMILVEGHMDVISLYQAGIQYAVASMGTALTIEQCREIKRYADIVYVSYDGDSAGQKATIRGLDLLKNQGLEVKVVSLTDNLDPDDYIRKFGREGYEKLLEEALPLIDFKLHTIEKHHTLETSDDKVKYAREALSVLKDLDSVEQNVYVKAVSKKSGLDANIILNNIENVSSDTEEVEQKEKKTTDNKEQTALKLAENYVLSCMYFGKHFVKIVDVTPDIFQSEDSKKVINYILDCGKQNQYPRADKLYEMLENEQASQIVDALDGIKGENQEEYYNQSLIKIKKDYKIKEKARLLDELNSEVDEVKKMELKQQLVKLTKMTF